MMREAQGTTSRGLITAQDAEQCCGFQEKLWMYLAPLMLITRQVTQACDLNSEKSYLHLPDCFEMLHPGMSKFNIAC